MFGLLVGVVNFVNGGCEVVEGIFDYFGIDVVLFVGSVLVVKIVYERLVKVGKCVQVLGGAKNHMVVMFDVVLELIVNGIIGFAFGVVG